MKKMLLVVGLGFAFLGCLGFLATEADKKRRREADPVGYAAEQAALEEAAKKKVADEEKRRQEGVERRKEADAKRREDEQRQKEHDRKYGTASQAKEMGISYVKDQLNFPATAKFSIIKSPTLGNDGVWELGGTLTAKNAFGVKTEWVWNCRLKVTGAEETAKEYTTIWSKVEVSLVEKQLLEGR